jgi:Cu/Ag efflux pump CusA
VRSPLGIQVFGDNLDEIEKAAISVEHAVAQVPGTRSAFAERSTGGFYIDFEVKREEAARHGLSVQDVNMVVAQSIGGADVMKRIAAPMVGGLVTSFLLELSVYPAIFAIWKGRGLPEEPAALG